MELDMNESHWKTACPKVDCKNKNACRCGLKHVNIPASIGDDSEGSPVEPKNGDYCNAIVIYEANKHVYIYSAEGIPTLIDVDATNISELEALTERALERIDEIEDVVVNCFDTVADMKASTALMNGSYAQTLGFHSINDGGAGLYKITGSGTANEMDVIAIGSTLYANLIYKNEINVKQLGAYADNTHDDYQAFSRGTALTNTLYIPNGTYLVNTAVNIDNCMNIKGQSVSNTIITAPSGFLTWSANRNYRHLGNFSIDGSSANDNVGIDCDITFSKMENIKIRRYATAINFGDHCYINEFENITILNCTNGYTGGNGVFNNNTFYNCYFQNIAGIVSDVKGYNINYIGCNFEKNGTCFGSWGEINVSDSYFEYNNNIIKISGASYNAKIHITGSWLYAPTNVTGWLADLPSFTSVDNRTAQLLIDNSHILLNSTNRNKPFAFNSINSGTKTYWGISLFNNVYQNVGTGTNYRIYYDWLIDTTNAPQYGTNANPTTWSTDLPVYNYQGLVLFRSSLGNDAGANRTNYKMHLTGRYAVEQSSGSMITITPDKKYYGITSQINDLICYVEFTDYSIEPCRFSIDANNIYVYIPNYDGRTTKHIQFDVTYYFNYGS